MKVSSKSKTVSFATLLVLCLSRFAVSGPYIAYSLNKAEKVLVSAEPSPPELTEIGGITHPVGIVYDKDKRDLIIIGQVNEGEQKIALDDFVVALRAILKHGKPPLVSIDRTSDTEKNRKQKVRFEGGIENTKFGKDLLDADIVLKRMGLGKIATETWGVQSYFDMSVEDWENTGREDSISSRFWFKPSNEESFVAAREGVAVVKRLRVEVKTEVTGATESGQSVDDLSFIRDEVGDSFAGAVASSFDDVSTCYPSLKRLDSLFRLAGLAEGILNWTLKYDFSLPKRDFWLEEYRVEKVETPTEHPLLTAEESLQNGEKKRKMTIDGGIELSVLIRDLKDGVVTAFKDIVIKARPEGNPLIWKVPLEGWQESTIERSEEHHAGETSDKPAISRRLGMSLTKQIYDPGSSSSQVKDFGTNVGTPSLSNGMPGFSFTHRLSPTTYSRDIGGVMLQGVAKVGSGGKAQVDLTGGNFSLIVDGKGACLSPQAFRKFVTALWSVYYSNQDPGISIDPIAPGIDKHMVRYIGKVINTDLGRVMREADYLMKTWSIGTARPDIRGFQSPDDVSGKRGYAYLGASRFWFVPQDMRFKRAGELLLFDSGQMTVQTEYLFDNGTGMNADPANEQFADFLTTRYGEFAKKYPVLQELFDYAKMVSLAKYLKESGVPLYWFLMANKDLVLTEDSPGTVEALAKGSDYFKNLRIEGGVDLGVESNYVYDSQAVRAIQDAASRYGGSTSSTSTASYRVREVPAVGRPFSFDLDGQGYSVVPQHSLTSGKDRRGIRYQTDFALRARGFKLTEESWEALKRDVTRREFARRWNPLVEKMSEAELEREAKRLYEETLGRAEEHVARDLENLKDLAGEKFDSEEAFTRAVERVLGSARDPNVVLLSKKHAYYQTDLEVVRFFNPKMRRKGQFGEGWQLLIPYQIKPHGTGKRDFLNIRIPEKMAVENLITGEREILTFSTDRYKTAGYVPDKIESSQVVGLFLMTDASYRLADKLGNQFHFDPAGYLTEMAFSRNHRVNIKYLDSLKDAFKESPYRVQPASRERVQVLNVTIPKVMTVSDLLNDSSEDFVYTEKIASYIPKNGVESRFEVLSLMTDGSFRLRDKQGNKIDFGPDGKFASFDNPFGDRMIKSISAGPYKVNFGYTLGSSGQMLVAGARLSEDGGTNPLYTVRYDYDQEGRLCKAERANPQQARLDESNQNVVLVAKD